MAKIVELPDGREAEFPDEMSNDAIGEVLRKQFGSPQPSRTVTPLKERLVQGFLDPIIGAAQLAEKIPGLPQARKFLTGSDTTMTDVVRNGVDNYKGQADYVAPEGIDWARMGGNVASPVSWVGGGASPLRAAYAGAVQGGLAPVGPDADFAAEKAKQAGLGAVGGAVLTKALSGLRGTPEAHALMARGVQPTVGQSLGGVANTVEQKLTSVPFVGDAITYARNRAQKEFEAAALQRATGGGPQQAQTIPQRVQQLFSDTRIPGTSTQVERATVGSPRTLDEANAIAAQQFDAVVQDLRPIPNWASSVPTAVQKALGNAEMTTQNKRMLQGIVNEHLDPAKLQTLTGEELKHLDSQLGYLIRKYAGGSPADKTMADELRNVQSAFRTDLNTMLPANLDNALNEANTTWARLVPVNKAASARADERITPRALQRALASQARKDVTRMPPDALVDNAVAVLPNNIPDSGTAGRAMLGGGALVGGGALGVLPQMFAVGVPAALGATRPVQRAIMGNTATQRALQPHDATLAALLAAALRGQTNE